MSLPNTIHQIWTGPPLPAHLAAWVAGVKAMHPGWTHRLWTNETLGELDERLPALIGKVVPAALADLSRLIAVARFGGIYLDTDVEVLKPLGGLRGYRAFAARQRDGVVCNAVFGAEPDHPWVVRQIAPAWAMVEQPYGCYGPYLMTATYPESTHLLPPHLFYSWWWDTPREQQVVHPEALAVHHWRKSWL